MEFDMKDKIFSRVTNRVFE